MLTCRITAEGPVFVSDSREVHPAGDEHRSYRFFRDPDGSPCIPASTLRGVVRSVFEAVTNSCWEHVADRRLSHRITARDAQPLVPARLFRHRDSWRAELLTGTTGFRPDGPKGNEPLYAAWVLAHRPHAHGRTRPHLPGWLKHGTEAWARIRKQPYQKIDRRTETTTTVFHYW
ncbi:MAG TPA: RAMP superfamily CRISPR-associated protein, partial [Longimicrobium sp.]|nr:RAMP superfamily CRISPR-associated protein [Longimicrobium sp.]